MARRDGMIKNQQKPSPIEDDTSDFPCDIILNILSRLPVKSLLRFKAVCKSWNATIKDRGFAKIRSNRQFNISNSHCFSAVGTSRGGIYKMIKFQGQDLYENSVVEFPSIEFDCICINFLCCCEAILLFKPYSDEPSYLLWNPFTRNYSTFSCPYRDLIPRKPQLSYGLCFDKYHDDYKVIVVLFRSGKYLVYSIKNDSWSKRRSKFRGYLFDSEGGTYVDGVVYWIAGRESRKAIVYFDPKNNLLKELHKPTDLELGSRDDIFVTNLSGNLCFHACHQQIVKIWLLKESGGCKFWMKLMTFDINESTVISQKNRFHTFALTPICLTRENEVVFRDLYGSSYAAYCLEKQKFGEIKEFPALWSIIVFMTCWESLNFPVIPKVKRAPHPVASQPGCSCSC